MDREISMKKPNKYWVVLIAVPLVVLVLYAVGWRYPLPSDDEMIKDFYEHKEEFEELVRRYREFDADAHHGKWVEQGNTRSILERAGIDRIQYGSYEPWLPDPYSIETAKSIDQQLEIQPRVFHSQKYKYRGLIIKKIPRQRYSARSLYYVSVWKDFYHIPKVPRIENGELLWPVRATGEYSARRRIFLTLDQYPESWKRFECVFKQVEPNWYLRMCNGH